MKIPNSTPRIQNPSRSDQLLRSIADVLELPIEKLKDRKLLDEDLGANELLKLWFGIKSKKGRDAALASLKAIVDAQHD